MNERTKTKAQLQTELAAARQSIAGLEAALAPQPAANPRPGVAAFALEKGFAEMLATSLPGVVYLFDREGKLLWWNRNGEEVTGYSAAELAGASMAQFVPAEDRARVQETFQQIMTTGVGSLETRLVRKSGASVPYHFSGKRVEFVGAPCLIGTGIDITERVRLERRRAVRLAVPQLLAHAATLRAVAPRLLQTIGECLGWDLGALWTVDRQDKVLRCLEVWHAPTIATPVFEHMSRRAAFDAGVGLPGRVWSTGRPAWIPDVVQDPNFPRAAVAATEGLHGAFACPLGTGAEMLGVIEFFSNAVREPDADLLEMMATVGGQIGHFLQRKEAEEELRANEARKAAMLEAALDAIITIDHDERILEFNPAAEKTFGHARAAVLGRRLSELIIPPAYRAAHRQGMRRYLATGEGPVLGRRVELPALRADGTEFPAEISIVPTLLDGRPIFTGYLRDITERKQAEHDILQLNRDLERRVEERTAELSAANAALEAASRLKDNFLATVSHELRTPLNGVIGMVDLLGDTELDDRQRRYAEVAHTSANLLMSVINDILDFSRIEAGKLDLETLDFNPAEVVEEVAAVVAMEAQGKKLELDCAIEPAVDTWISGDRGRLRQVLLNLVANAIKFTEQGEVVVRAALQERSEGCTRFVFRVTDTGIGIPADRLERLFQPFSQGDASMTRRFGGSGLGLAISRHLARMMGGRISVESVPRQGSTFSFTVQFAAPAVPRDRPPLRLDALRGQRALIVDDSATSRQILEQQLTACGVACSTASDGPQALTCLSEAVEAGRPFDLAILDGQMPGMDGEQLGSLIKADPRLAATQLVMLSWLSRHVAPEEWRARGFSGWATKPIGRRQLLETIAVVVTGAGAAESSSAKPPSEQRLRGLQSSWRRATHDPLSTPAGEPAPQRSLRVLVAEDNKANQMVAEALLRRMGHVVRVAESGLKAVAAFRQEPFDLVLMDLQMPDMDGLQATTEIRSHERTRGTHTPVVGLTAHAVKGDRQRCLAGGMDAYLTKPINRQELLAVLETLMAIPAADPGTGSAPFQPPAPAPATIDRGRVLARLEGDEQLLRELIEVYLREWPQLLTELRQALAEGNLGVLAFKAHRLTGLAKTFDAHDASAAAARLEELGREGRLAQVGPQTAEVEQHFFRLESDLRSL